MREVKAEAIRWAGNDPVKRFIAKTAIYGVLAPAFGIDVSQRVGMSNTFSGEFYGEKPDSVGGMIAQQLGGPAVTTALGMIRQANEGNPIEVLKAFSPALGNIAQAFVGESRTTHHRVKSRYEDMHSRIMHGLGFRTVSESENAFIVNYEYEQKQQLREEKKDAIQSYLDNPSAENKAKLHELGVTDKQVKEESMNQSRTATERATLGRPKTTQKKPPSPAQRRKEMERRAKETDSLFSAIDEDDRGY